MIPSLISESRGFVARNPGTEYVNPKDRDDIAIFNGIIFLPEKGVAFNSHEDMTSAYQQWKTTAGGTVYELNTPNRGMQAAMVIDMDTPRGPEKYVLFTRDLARLEGKLINIPAGVIPGHGGYVMNRDVSRSETAGVKPSDVIVGNKRIKPSEVPDLLDAARSTAGDETIDEMQEYLDALLAGNGSGYVIKGGAANAKLHAKYLGEWASPIALITGQFSPAAQYNTIVEQLTGGTGFADAAIRYGTSVRDALVDSTIVGAAYEIGISSKAKTGGGAAASLQGLQDAMVKQADKFGDTFWADPKNAEFKRITETITSKSAVDGVLELAVQRGIIGAEDAALVREGLKASNKGSWKPNHHLRDEMDSYDARQAHPQYDPAKHALAAIARSLADELNSEDYTDTIRQVLNYASMVQMYFRTTIKGSDLVCNGFDLVWPPTFDGMIRFDPGKSFSATEIKGKMGFKIGKGAALIPDPDETLQVKISPAAADKERRMKAQKAQRAVGRITTPGERDVRDPTVPDVVALGRRKKPIKK